MYTIIADDLLSVGHFDSYSFCFQISCVYSIVPEYILFIADFLAQLFTFSFAFIDLAQISIVWILVSRILLMQWLIFFYVPFEARNSRFILKAGQLSCGSFLFVNVHYVMLFCHILSFFYRCLLLIRYFNILNA